MEIQNDESLLVEGQNLTFKTNALWRTQNSSRQMADACDVTGGDVDDDYEDIARILERLEVSHASLLPRISLACTCMSTARHTLTSSTLHARAQHHNEAGGGDACHVVSCSDESSDDNDESFKLAHVLRALALYERKPVHRRGASLGALRNLILSYVPREDIGDDDTQTILELLDGEDHGLREMALLAMRQLCERENNAFKFLFHDALPKLLLYLELETYTEHHEHAALALEQLVKHRAFKDWWHDVMRQGGFASLLEHVQPDQPLPVRYACACVLRALAQYDFYANLIIHNAMPLVTVFKSMNSDFQEVYTGIMGALMLQADERTVALLNTDALPSSLNMLQQGPCGVQQQALLLICSLANSAAGLHAMLQDPSTVPMLLSALINTECRKTRQNAALAVSKITSTKNPAQQKQFLLHVDKFHHETEDRIDEAAGEENADRQRLPEMSPAEKMDRAIADLGRDLVQLISKLGKMERDLIGNVIDIHLAPCFDTDVSDLTTLCHVLQIVANLLHFTAGQVKLKAFEEEYSTQKKLINSLKQSLEVNYKLCQILIKQRILCVSDLLSVYTQKLLDVVSICSKPLQSMCGMSKAQILFQAWGSQSETMSTAGKVNITTIFDENEAEVVTQLLQVLSIITCSTISVTERDETTLESKISERMNNHSGNCAKDQVPLQPKSKKNKTKHFHSKAACELCRKNGNVSADPSKPQRSHSRAQGDKSNKPQFTHEPVNCDHMDQSSEDSINMDLLESVFRSALDKQVSSQQRDVRIALFESGVVESVGPWLMSSHAKHQSLVLSIIRGMVQPVHERISPSPPKQPKLHNAVRPRPSALSMNAKERDQAMEVALYQMSSRMKQFIEEALGRPPNAHAPANTPRDPTVPDSASSMREPQAVSYRHTENAAKAVQRGEMLQRRGKSAGPHRRSNMDPGSSAIYKHEQSVSSVEKGNTTYRQQDYDKFARSNSSVSFKPSRPNSAALKLESTSTGPVSASVRPGSARSGVSVNSSRSQTSSIRSSSHTRLNSARQRSRRKSVSPKRRRRPSSAAPETRPKDGYQVIVKPSEENTRTISIAKSIDLLSSSSSDSMGDAGSTTTHQFPSVVYDLDRRRSEVNVSDAGHNCDVSARPRSGSMSARSRARERQNSAVSVENSSAPIGQRYPRRVWVPWKPQLQPTQAVAEQCRCLVAMVIGKVLVQHVFAKDVQLRKDVLDFMDQYIKHGQVESHMKLSEQGVVPRMLDFLRVNDQDDLLEMMGLSVVGQLLKSDGRLVEVFERQGGTDLLVSMSSCSTGPLRQHVAETLSTVTRAKTTPSKRAMSAPVKRRTGQPDIWDQIMQRWKQEDQVVKTVLNKFSA